MNDEVRKRKKSWEMKKRVKKNTCVRNANIFSSFFLFFLFFSNFDKKFFKRKEKQNTNTNRLDRCPTFFSSSSSFLQSLLSFSSFLFAPSLSLSNFWNVSNNFLKIFSLYRIRIAWMHSKREWRKKNYLKEVESFFFGGLGSRWSQKQSQTHE